MQGITADPASLQVNLSQVLKSVQSELSMHEVTQPLSEQWSLKVDLFCLNGFELYYKLTLEKNDWHTLYAVLGVV